MVNAHRSSDSGPGSFDSKFFRTVLGCFPTGVTVITGISEDDRPNGFTIGSFTSVSLDPPLVGFLPQTDSETWESISDAGSFCVNVLSSAQSDLCWKFAKSGNEASRFDGVTWKPSPSGAPILDGVVAWIDCSVESVQTMGDHYFVLGRVTSLDHSSSPDSPPVQPLVFYRGTLGEFAAQP